MTELTIICSRCEEAPSTGEFFRDGILIGYYCKECEAIARAEVESEDDGIGWDDDDDDRSQFADPGGRSALRAGERVHPCPTCERPNRLTAADVQLGYQCDTCADNLERGIDE